MMMKYETHLNSHILNTKSLSVCPISKAIEGLCERTEYLDIFFLPITQWCSIFDVLFTGGRGVSDFTVLKYY